MKNFTHYFLSVHVVGIAQAV